MRMPSNPLRDVFEFDPSASQEGLKMAGHRRIGTGGHRQTRQHQTRLRARVVGAGTAAGAFLAFGMTPLATTPSAHADDFVSGPHR